MMSLNKTLTIDKIEVVGKYKHIHVREKVVVTEDGNVISESYNRKVIAPNQDYSNEHADVQAMCKQFHTQEVINSYNAMLAEQESAMSV